MIDAIWSLIATHPFNTVFSLAALIYGICVVARFWRVSNNPATETLKQCDKINAIIWTVVPPIWFFFEYYVVNAHAGKVELESLKQAQDLARNFWAAILATILFLKPK